MSWLPASIDYAIYVKILLKIVESRFRNGLIRLADCDMPITVVRMGVRVSGDHLGTNPTAVNARGSWDSSLDLQTVEQMSEQVELDHGTAGPWQPIYDSMRRNVIHQVAAGTIHESLQPLYAIGNLAAACRNTIQAEGEFDRQKVLGWLSVIASTVVDAKGLLLRLKKFADSSTPRITTVCLDEVIKPIAQMLADELKHAAAKIEFDLDCDVPVGVDVSQLQQVLAELVFNSSTAFKGSSAQSHCVKVRTWHDRGFCHVSVEDNGPGISAETLGDVFKPFYSGSSERPGLGLSMCKSTIAAHGGTILAKSTDSGGFCVHFKIPGIQSSSNVQQSDHLHY